MTFPQIDATIVSERLKVSLAVSLFLSLTLFFFGPVNLYYTNIREMPFIFSNVWYYILAVSLVIGLLLFILIWWSKGPYHTKLSTLAFALGFLFWVQGNILVWNYGLLDGHEIVWGNYLLNGVIDSLVWICILVAAFIYSKRLYRYVGVLCILLIIMQAAGLMVTAYSAPEEPEWKNLQPSPDNSKMYEFSKSMNVIIIILDTFQSDIFQEIIDANPKYANMFDGFTYYRNNVGGFPTTYLSINYILSGKLYDNSVPISQFIKDTSLNNSLPLLLKENGVRVDVRTAPTLIFPSNKIYDKIEGFSWKTRKGDSAEFISETTPLYRLTFFRFVPQVMKRFFYLTSPTFTLSTEQKSPDMDAYHNFAAIRVSAPEKIFKLFHLLGPHAPFYLNEDLEYEDLPQNITGYISQAKASLKISHALLESLKGNGSYNNSLIFIIGDHGTGAGAHLVSGGTPLMLVKPFNSTGPLKISDVPVSHGDIPRTIAEELKIRNNLTGSSIFSVNETDSRIRTYYNYIWELGDWASDFLPPLREYKVSGFSWNTTSWEPTFMEYTSKGVKYTPPQKYVPSSIIHFGIGGNADQYLTEGWSFPDDRYRWTDGHAAIFTFSLPKPETDLMLNLSFTPYLAGQMKSQRLSIWINGHKLKDVLLTGDMPNLIIEVPQNYFEEKIQMIKFDLPDAISPNDLGISGDFRTLGIAFRTLSMNSPPQYIKYSVIYFGIGGNADQYLTEGWSFPDDGYRWTDGHAAIFTFSLPKPETDLMLNLSFTPYLAAQMKSQRLSIWINDHKLKDVLLTGDMPNLIIDIPKNYFEENTQRIKFDLPDAISPKDLGISGDFRTLGIAVRTLSMNSPPQYIKSSIIHFGIGGNADQYLAEGWSFPDDGYRWTDGHAAIFTFSLPKPETDLMLNLSFTPYLAGQMKSQRLSIWINDHKLKDILLTGDMPNLIIDIPKNYFEENTQRIKFDLPDAISPKDLGISGDFRTLGIAVRTLSVETATAHL